MHSFVGNKQCASWLWLAICRRTKQIVAYYIGDRSQYSAMLFYNNIPKQYQHCKTFSDSWQSYAFLSSKNHTLSEKGSGETNTIEGFNNHLRQRLSRLVRKTCSFSKSSFYHHLVISWFIYLYNLSVIS